MYGFVCAEIKAADEPVGIRGPSILQKITEKFSEFENQLKGKRASELEDPHPELAYIPAAPQEAKPSLFFKAKDYFGYQTGSGQGEEETINPEAVPKQVTIMRPPIMQFQGYDVSCCVMLLSCMMFCVFCLRVSTSVGLAHKVNAWYQ